MCDTPPDPSENTPADTLTDPADLTPAAQTNYCSSGGDDTDGCSGVDPAAPAAPVADPPPVADDGASQADQARGPQSQPLAQTLDPIIEPPVQIFYQYAATPYTSTWMKDVMRRPGQRNGVYPPKVPKGLSPNGWDNGCHPISFTMVLRWWSEVFIPTLSTPGNPPPAIIYSPTNQPIPKPLDPVQMCQLFTGTPYFDSYLPGGVTKKPRCKKCNTELPNPAGVCPGSFPDCPGATITSDYLNYGPGDWCVNHDMIAVYAQKLSFEGASMTFTAYPCANGTADDAKKKKLKEFLALGPVMVNISKPGHFVVATGYRDNIIYVCDPGWVLRRYDDQKPFVNTHPQNRQLSAGEDCAGHPGYVTVDDSWLKMVIRLESITFPSAIGEGENAAFFQDHTTGS